MAETIEQKRKRKLKEQKAKAKIALDKKKAEEKRRTERKKATREASAATQKARRATAARQAVEQAEQPQTRTEIERTEGPSTKTVIDPVTKKEKTVRSLGAFKGRTVQVAPGIDVTTPEGAKKAERLARRAGVKPSELGLATAKDLLSARATRKKAISKARKAEQGQAVRAIRRSGGRFDRSKSVVDNLNTFMGTLDDAGRQKLIRDFQDPDLKAVVAEDRRAAKALVKSKKLTEPQALKLNVSIRKQIAKLNAGGTTIDDTSAVVLKGMGLTLGSANEIDEKDRDAILDALNAQLKFVQQFLPAVEFTREQLLAEKERRLAEGAPSF